MRSIHVTELRKKIKDGASLQLIDVREPFEHELFNIGGELIPLGSLMENLEKISHDRPVVFYCQKGIRSQLAIQRLSLKLNIDNLFNLHGGMEAWKKSILPGKENGL